MPTQRAQAIKPAGSSGKKGDSGSVFAAMHILQRGTALGYKIFRVLGMNGLFLLFTSCAQGKGIA